MVRGDREEYKEAQGTAIDWAEGKNATVKTVKKKQKSKSIIRDPHRRVETKEVRVVTRTVETESFFNFFKTKVPDDSSDDDSEEKEDEKSKEHNSQFDNHTKIAEEFINEIVPRALYYYLDMIDYEEDAESEGSDEEANKGSSSKEEDGGIDDRDTKRVRRDDEVKKEDQGGKSDCKPQ